MSNHFYCLPPITIPLFNYSLFLPANYNPPFNHFNYFCLQITILPLTISFFLPPNYNPFFNHSHVLPPNYNKLFDHFHFLPPNNNPPFNHSYFLPHPLIIPVLYTPPPPPSNTILPLIIPIFYLPITFLPLFSSKLESPFKHSQWQSPLSYPFFTSQIQSSL